MESKCVIPHDSAAPEAAPISSPLQWLWVQHFHTSWMLGQWCWAPWDGVPVSMKAKSWQWSTSRDAMVLIRRRLNQLLFIRNFILNSYLDERRDPGRRGTWTCRGGWADMGHDWYSEWWGQRWGPQEGARSIPWCYCYPSLLQRLWCIRFQQWSPRGQNAEETIRVSLNGICKTDENIVMTVLCVLSCPKNVVSVQLCLYIQYADF